MCNLPIYFHLNYVCISTHLDPPSQLVTFAWQPKLLGQDKCCFRSHRRMQKESKTYWSVHWGTMSWWAICSGFGGPVQSVHSSFTYKHVASNSAGVTKYIHQASSTLELCTHPKCQAALSAKEVGPGLLLRPQIVDINARSRWVMSMRWC